MTQNAETMFDELTAQARKRLAQRTYATSDDVCDAGNAITMALAIRSPSVPALLSHPLVAARLDEAWDEDETAYHFGRAAIEMAIVEVLLAEWKSTHAA